MIVKNEEKMLERTLPNLVKLVDEVIIVDTGSADDTKKIAQKYTSKIYDFPWINDFSAARNESLKFAEGDWVIWVDADEFVKEEDMDKIKRALKDAKDDAFLLKVNECREGEFSPISYNMRPKLFRNRIGIHFERPINEQPFMANGELAAIQAKELDIPIYHWGGFLSAEKHKLKKLRNIELLKGVVDSGKGDASSYFLIGLNYRDLKQYDEAVAGFNEVIAKYPNTKIALAAREEKAWTLYLNKKVKEAYLESLEILKFDPESMIAANIIGEVFMVMGEVEKAVDAFRGAANTELKSDSIIVSLRQKEYVANMFLSNALLKLGRRDEAYQAAEKAFRFDPTEEAREAMEQARPTLNNP